MKKASIIGSGIGGLAAALRLRKKGYDVTVFEANSYFGGKINSIEQNGFRWDTGPSLFTMPGFVEELFGLFEVDPKSYFHYLKCEEVCRYFWEDGTRFTANADKQQFIKKAAEVFNEDGDKISSYLKNAKLKYDLTAPLFLEKSLHKINTYLSKETLSAISKIGKLDLMSTLHGINRQKLNNPKLVQFFDRYATYNGSSPYKTPGIMSLIPHLEMHHGTYLPKNGMHAIAKSLFEFGMEQGVEFRFSEPVLGISHEQKTATAVETPQGVYESDLIVSNMDIFSTYRRLLSDIPQPERILKQERSSSALIFYWGINREFDKLGLHNIFFSENYHQEFQNIFDLKKLDDDPTIYINITSKHLPGDAPPGCENWFVMINVPSNEGDDWNKLSQKARAVILNKLKRNLGVDIEPLIIAEEKLDPVMIEEKTSSHQGSLYGTSSNSMFSAFLRHPNFSSKLKNLYFVGGSVHPGGGIPLSLLSAKIATNLIPDCD